jgi:hypothetical protein
LISPGIFLHCLRCRYAISSLSDAACRHAMAFAMTPLQPAMIFTFAAAFADAITPFQLSRLFHADFRLTPPPLLRFHFSLMFSAFDDISIEFHSFLSASASFQPFR